MKRPTTTTRLAIAALLVASACGEGRSVASSSSAFIRRRIMAGRHTVQKPIASLMAVGLLLLAACGTGEEVEPGPITSFGDIAGSTHEAQGLGKQFFMQFFEDGTWHGSGGVDDA